ncbi:MAG: Uma2 family endonuclease [Myxococcaceae bacterium]|nr:Uma2 family endonuclease [Myxococcaceae bacterium]
MSTARRVHHSYEDYLHALEASEIKLEYFDGEVYALAGGTLAHAELGARAIALLTQALGNRCRVLTSDAKVQVEATGLATFPDATVSCGEMRSAANDRNALVNPAVLVEVTSKGTEDYDRGEKLNQYRQIPSLKAVLLVSHRSVRVTVVERTPSGWATREVRASEQVALQDPELSLSVDALYAGIALDAG